MYYGEYNIYNKSLKQEQYNNDYRFGCQKRRCIIISNAERIKMECISMMFRDSFSKHNGCKTMKLLFYWLLYNHIVIMTYVFG